MKRLFSRLMLAFMGVLLLSTLTRSVALTRFMRQSARTETAREALADARAISAWAQERWDRPPADLRPSLGTMARVASARVWLVDATGQVRVDTQGNPSWEGALVSGDELEQARRGAETTVSGRSPWLESAVASVVPITREGRVIGAVFLFVPEQAASARGDLLSLLLWTALLALSVSGVAVYVISRTISRPVEEITRFARDMGDGRFGAGIAVSGVAEVNELAATLTRVNARLRASFATLEEERQRLESILLSIQEGVVAIDNEHQMTVLNGAAARLLHLPDPNHLPVPLAETELPGVLRQALLEAAQGKTVEGHLRLRGQDLLAACVPIPGVDGYAGAVAVVRDLEAVMRLQRMRENFVADVAHELRGPLANLGVLAEAFGDGTIA